MKTVKSFHDKKQFHVAKKDTFAYMIQDTLVYLPFNNVLFSISRSVFGWAAKEVSMSFINFC